MADTIPTCADCGWGRFSDPPAGICGRFPHRRPINRGDLICGEFWRDGPEFQVMLRIGRDMSTAGMGSVVEVANAIKRIEQACLPAAEELTKALNDVLRQGKPLKRASEPPEPHYDDCDYCGHFGDESNIPSCWWCSKHSQPPMASSCSDFIDEHDYVPERKPILRGTVDAIYPIFFIAAAVIFLLIVMLIENL